MSAYKCWCGRSLSSAAQCVVHGSGYESPQDGTVATLRAQLADAVRDRDAAVRQTLITETALEDACRLISGGVLRAAGCHVSEGADTPQWFVDRAYIARNALEKTR